MPQITELAALMRNEYITMQSWDKVADRHHITKPLAWRIAKKGYEPRRYAIRKLLDLPQYANVIPIGDQIPDGTQAHSAQQCKCGQWFISNHPRRVRCFICSPYRGKKAASR